MTLIDLKYYETDGGFIGETAYRSEHSAADPVREELSNLNKTGRLPGATGRIGGFVSFEISTVRKNNQGLVRLA